MKPYLIGFCSIALVLGVYANRNAKRLYVYWLWKSGGLRRVAEGVFLAGTFICLTIVSGGLLGILVQGSSDAALPTTAPIRALEATVGMIVAASLLWSAFLETCDHVAYLLRPNSIQMEWPFVWTTGLLVAYIPLLWMLL